MTHAERRRREVETTLRRLSRLTGSDRWFDGWIHAALTSGRPFFVAEIHGNIAKYHKDSGVPAYTAEKGGVEWAPLVAAEYRRKHPEFYEGVVS